MDSRGTFVLCEGPKAKTKNRHEKIVQKTLVLELSHSITALGNSPMSLYTIVKYMPRFED